MSHHAIVIGAGIAGLSAARTLAASGVDVVVVDSARGVGGRCATRSIHGQRVDFGVAVLHGASAAFVGAIRELEAEAVVRDWPTHMRGDGTACQPQAFQSQAIRIAPRSGVSLFAKRLAQGLRVELETRVDRVEVLNGKEFVLQVPAGRMRATSLVVACPGPQAGDLLAPLAGGDHRLRSLLAAWEQARMVPCLALMAGYDRPSDTDWHLVLPGPTLGIHSLVNDSSKREPGQSQVLVIQASPSFSTRYLESDPSEWANDLLAGAASQLGAWVRHPVWMQTHRWRHARVQRGNELARPVVLRWEGGATLGLCGDAFHPAGGVEGAWLSGRDLAERWIAESAMKPAADASNP